MKADHSLRGQPLRRAPALLARMPLPAEAWERISPTLPPSVHRLLDLRHRLPRPSGPWLVAGAIPAGLLLGCLMSWAVDPAIMQHGGKPYAEAGNAGVQVQLPRHAGLDEAFPEDPAPFGYPDQPVPAHLAAGIAEAGDYAEAAGTDAESAAAAAKAVLVSDGQVLGNDAPAAGTDPASPGARGRNAGAHAAPTQRVSAAQPAPAPAAPLIQVVPQRAPQ